MILKSCLTHVDAVTLDEAVRSETRSRESHLPPVSVYRWWARRTEAVNGALLDAVSREAPGRLLVADPFVGGGVIALSALKRGHAFYAQDLNPWVGLGLAAMLDLPDAAALSEAADQLMARTSSLATRAYATRFADGSPAQISQTLRVMRSRCIACGHEHRLFPHALVSLLKRKERTDGEAFLACAHGHLFRGQSTGLQTCPSCADQVDPSRNYQPQRRVTCPACGADQSLSQRLEAADPARDVVLVERSAKDRRELDFPTAQEIAQAAEESWRPTRSLGAIPDTSETRVLLRHGFVKWSDLYPCRQRHVMERVLAMVRRLEGEERLRQALMVAVLGTAEMAGHLSRWDRYYLKSYESMAAHRFNLTTFSAEPNVLGAGMVGRGTLRRRILGFEKAASWLRNEGIAPSIIRRESGPDMPFVDPSDTVQIVSGSSERLLLKDASVDVILTDPPYHDDVQYHDLSLPLRAWAGLSRAKLKGEAVSIPHARGLKVHSTYRALLTRIFSEFRRVLKRDGRLLFSYANREPAAWINLFAALRGSGFKPLGYMITRSENESDHAKRNGRNCACDLILELVPEDAEIEAVWRPEARIHSPEASYLGAVGDAFLACAERAEGWEANLHQNLKTHSFLQASLKGPAVETLQACDPDVLPTDHPGRYQPPKHGHDVPEEDILQYGT